MVEFLTYRKGQNVTLHAEVPGAPKLGTLGVVCDAVPNGYMLVKFKGRRTPMIVKRSFLRRESVTTLKLPKWA